MKLFINKHLIFISNLNPFYLYKPFTNLNIYNHFLHILYMTYKKVGGDK